MNDLSQHVLLITGAAGFLGSTLLSYAAPRWQTIGSYHQAVPAIDINLSNAIQLDICNQTHVLSVLRAIKPAAVIHCAAIADFNRCATDRDHAWEVNVSGTENLARAAAAVDAKLVYVSTDMVFSGIQGNYTEQDTPDPVCWYGQSKYAAEQIVAELCPNAVIARPALIFGHSSLGRGCFTQQIIQRLRASEIISLFQDEYRSPIALPTLCAQLLELATGHQHGVFHLGGPERLSRFEFGLRLAAAVGFNQELIVGNFIRDHTFADSRPADCSLCCAKAKQELSTAHPPLVDSLRALYCAYPNPTMPTYSKAAFDDRLSNSFA